MASNKKKKSWFETLCTMDEPIGRQEQGKKATAGQKTRVRVQNRANVPYGQDEEIPPFDDDASVPVEDLFEDEADRHTAPPKAPAKKSSGPKGSRPSETSSASRTKSSTGGRSGTGRSQNGRKEQNVSHKNDKPLPADAVYRAQPYVVLFLGALLAIMLLLSLIFSKGDFNYTAQTHPFRWVGYHVERLLFGLFGYGTYLMPLFMVYLSAIQIRDGKNYRSGGRGALAMAEIILLPTIIHTYMIHAGAADGQLNVFSLKELYVLGASKMGGGVVAGLLGTLANRGLGVIATTIIGVVLMLSGCMLLFGITPSGIKKWCVATRKARLRYAERNQPKPSKKEKEDPAVSAAAGRRSKAVVEDEGQEVALLPPAQTKQDKMREDALKEAERSDRKEGKRRTSPQQEEPTQEHYLDPMSALLAGSTRRRRGEPAEPAETPRQVEDEWAMETVYPDKQGAEASPLEYVSELTREQIDEMERLYEDAHRPAAPIVPLEFEAEEGDEAETLVEYPERVELDVDDTVLPEELPVDEVPVEAQDYQGGFDYSMETAEGDESADVGEEEPEIIGGVAVKIEKLSDEERERREDR